MSEDARFRHPKTPFPVGVEYYRGPVPRQDVWNADFARIKAAGFSIVRSFSMWNHMEPRQGKYELEDFDLMFDLAEKHGLSVWMDIALATHGACPEWLTRRHPDINVVNHRGERILADASAATPQGSQVHCYDHPAWRRYGGDLLRHVIERYKNRPNLLIWGLWDGVGPPTADGSLCYCDNTRARYKDWLRKRFTLDTLNEHALRRFGVIRPLKLVIDNYPGGDEEWLDAANHPNRPELGSRQVPFSRELYIERDDFMEDPPGKFRRLVPGGEVRLRYAYIIKCESVIKDASGQVTELRCSYAPESKSGSEQSRRKVKGTIHWVSAGHATRAEVRLYDRLFEVPNPERGDGDFVQHLNAESLEIVSAAALEPALAAALPGEIFQFERQGYFVVDTGGPEGGQPVWSRTVSLRDSWAKLERRALGQARD